MALWGKKDSLSNLTGTITIDTFLEVVTGSGTSFTTAGIAAGDIIVIGVGATYGQAVIYGVTFNWIYSIYHWNRNCWFWSNCWSCLYCNTKTKIYFTRWSVFCTRCKIK